MRIAFITSRDLRALYDDDRLAAEALRRRGHAVSPLVWTEAEVDALDAFDVLVMRSPWDWFHHRAQFRRFLQSLRDVRARVVNPAETMLAFADKTYLPRLEAKGLPVVPTVQLERDALDRVPALLAERQWGRAVLKPAFTANAVGAHRFEASEAARVVEVAAAAPDAEPWLLQPFVPGISDGERSFVFFAGDFSHAVVKRPPPGEWRVQHEYGGVASPVHVTPGEIAEAQALLQAAAPDAAYARVDAVPWQGRLHLMELELVEPELFFRHEAQAAERFAEAVLG